ncbi:hypothetical protein L1987_57794 [Smallanthus sonchifolius]|uniref:Uncharacterized protein n=1 Tax=Smallanthus sonchifolius TaxID=185202 RepID=A0ACB9DE02_9ASTR|nr:hypothetical protein L1987_57794 [Smallanthus sonchifolius]
MRRFRMMRSDAAHDAAHDQQNACENDNRRLAKHLDLKREGVCGSGGKQSIKRPDLKAVSKMIECNEVLFPTKRFGHLPVSFV